MAKRMLIDATHPEETRVVVLNGHRLDEFDFESSTKQQVKGNIYLAKVTRVEPSLQAAFVDYGGNRHGFLAISEIHSDYYRIPVGDRDSNGDMVCEDAPARGALAEGAEEAGVPLETALPEPVVIPEAPEGGDDRGGGDQGGDEAADTESDASAWAPIVRAPDTAAAEVERSAAVSVDALSWDTRFAPIQPAAELISSEPEADPPPGPVEAMLLDAGETDAPNATVAARSWTAALAEPLETTPLAELRADSDAEADEAIETIGGDDFEDAERQRSRTLRHYKIQEVIKRRQIMLVQVTKEERGNKGAALTTYLSLAGRYCVLMPNTARGGGVSRKITSITDRRRLKEILEELDIPEGMGVIVRTAGAERSKAEIKRDYEYLLRLWNEIRDRTLRSTAPALIYEEGNLIKRSIRDLYTRDIDEVLVEGEEGYRTAKAFMKMLMPSHAKRVQPYRDPQIGLLHRFQVESQIDAIHSPIAQLRSGGYIVINQTEALVAIDVNSGRSTRERNIEETALRTNLEAAEEIERQLRLRDLAGLIVIDFIDMEEHRNQSAVERRLKEALKNDRARIQVGRISPFGLLEMSRQRLRPSLVEASTQPCPHCGGTGFIRSTESTALYVLRAIEEEGMRRRAAEICVYVPTTVALYILNQKRESLAQIEARNGIHVLVARDDALVPPAFRIERLRAYGPTESPILPPAPLTQSPVIAVDEDEKEEEEEDTEELGEERASAGEAERPDQGADDERGRRRRRRRRRHEEPAQRAAQPASKSRDKPAREESELASAVDHEGSAEREGDEDGDAERQRRRRGRRGGRRRGRREGGAEPNSVELRPAADTVEILPTDEIEDEAPVMMEMPMSWHPESGVGIGIAAPDAGVEAASLPAFAGDPASAFAAAESADVLPIAEHPAVERPAATIIEIAEAPSEAPPSEVQLSEAQLSEAQLSEAPLSEAPLSEAPLSEAPLSEAPLSEALHSGQGEDGAPPPAADVGSGPALAVTTEAAPETTTQAPEPDAVSTEIAAAPPPVDQVQSVTGTPANPRRGWWQRLLQP